MHQDVHPNGAEDDAEHLPEWLRKSSQHRGREYDRYNPEDKPTAPSHAGIISRIPVRLVDVMKPLQPTGKPII
jgi:hypothetical protein